MSAFWRRPSLVIAFLAAAASGAVILLHALSWTTLDSSIQIVAPLVTIIVVALVAHSGGRPEDVFVDRLRGGLLAGAIGVIAYDLVRLVILLSGLVPFNPFRPIEIYGLLLLGTQEDSSLTKAAGWAFHIWNGLSFAAMYTLAIGRGRVLWGVVWGMLLQGLMVASYPSLFRILLDWAFLLVSSVGHLAYGLALGVTARRVIKC
jgi:hypothetical protein